jgi:ribonuclease BN (tRNA processing enzyme)
LLKVLVAGSFGDAFAWHTVHDGESVALDGATLRFSRTDHPPPTVAVEITHAEKRLVYTADTGAEWSVNAFGPGADLVLSEATYLHDDIRTKLHMSARQAGELAHEAQARRLMITHLWPTIDPLASVEEASEAFGHEVTLAAPHLSTHV